MYTILLMEGKTPKRCIGVFSSKLDATTWALSDGWSADQFKIMELWP